MSNWIKCSERLPEEDSQVIVYMISKVRDYQMMTISPFYDNKFECELAGRVYKVTHWQPLPEAPKD